MSKVPISDESLSDYQRVSFVVQCPTSLIEKSEKLNSIFHSARSGSKQPQYVIQIVENDEDCFKGCFVRLQLPKSKSRDEDTLKVDQGVEETFLIGHARERTTSADLSGTTTGVPPSAVTSESNVPVMPTVVPPTGSVTPAK